MEKQHSVLDMIHIQYETFFEQEKKIADYIIPHSAEVVNMTITELAKACGTSVATVTRFCKKCGVEGFHHLKIGLAREIAEQEPTRAVSNTISQDDIHQSLQNILANKIDELTQTVSLIDEVQLKEILGHLRKAGLVQFMAVGNTIPVALDGAFKFNSIGIPSSAGTVWETQLSFAMNLRKDDVLIAISNSGESSHVHLVVKEAKKRGAITIGITNNPDSSIGSAVDYHIQTATRERLFMNEFCFSRVSAVTIIEILYLFLTVGHKESYEQVRSFENLIANEKM